MPRSNNTLARYAGAAALTALGLGVAFLFQGLRGVPDGLVFTATVALTARFLGLGPSLFATVLSMVAIDYTMLPPIGKLEFSHPEEAAYFLVFVILALVISGMTHSLRLARDSAENVAARANRLLEVTTALSEAQLPKDVGRVVLTQGLDVLEAVLGVIAMYDSGEARVLERRRLDVDPDVRQISMRISLDESTPLTEAMRTRKTVWLGSAEEYARRFPEAAKRFRTEEGSNAVLAMPLVHGDELVGGLLLGFKESSAIGAADHAFAGLLAQSVGSALARAQTLEREQQDRRSAELLLHAREEVLGIVAHDLRNPLGVAGAVMQVLADEQLEKAERDKLLHSGTHAVEQMNRLIGDLLDVIRAEAGKLSIEKEDLSVAAVLTQAEEGARHRAQERHVDLKIERPDTSLHVCADRGRLAQVFDNLLGNAIKFTPAGGQVTVRSWPDDSNVVFEVADTGPGIPPESVTHLFDRFWQANRTDRRGVGLGLPITKGIVDAHGGKIWVDTKPGQGSRFFFSLPRRERVSIANHTSV